MTDVINKHSTQRLIAFVSLCKNMLNRKKHARRHFMSFFSVTRRSRSDDGQSVSQSVTDPSLADFTDVTLVSEDTDESLSSEKKLSGEKKVIQ